MAIDKKGNVYVSGNYAGSGTTFESTTINNTGNYNGYIAKLDSLVNTIPTIKVQLLTQAKRMEVPIRNGHYYLEVW